MDIQYKLNADITAQQFADLLHNSTLGERRPVDDINCLQGMLDNSNLVVSAWIDNTLVGISRSVTDFHFCCYLSDLAVDKAYQKYGIGRALQSKTQELLGPRCTLILLAAPAAHSYYEHVGYDRHERCWVLDRDSRISE
ncbi:MAG: GNAT family N-acetyltransferase [Oleiphilaceae bacterium]|nr:GNAT family N-acetyltransferase [Oleiphilaceae bacterium]